jgi:hypothetical protein
MSYFIIVLTRNRDDRGSFNDQVRMMAVWDPSLMPL